MNKSLVVIFLPLAFIFAGVHYVATAADLYWYFWWFDLVMHFWGGILIGFGVHTLSTFSRLNYQPTLPILLIVLAFATSFWEVFEGWAGLHDPETFVIDTTQDILLGFLGGLLAHSVLKRYTIK